MHPEVIKNLREFFEAELGTRLMPGALVLSGPAAQIDLRACAVLSPLLQRIFASSSGPAPTRSHEQVSISWRRDEEGRCLIEWATAGGPEEAPSANGHASSAHPISDPAASERTIGLEACGDAMRIAVPAAHVAFGDTVTAEPAVDPLQGQTLLVVEDQLIIALDLEMVLRQHGAADVHVFGTADEALQLITQAPPDAAVLDINLGSSTSFPVARELMRLGVPFIFASGYGKEADLPAEFQAIPLIGKPYSATAISHALATLTATAA